MYIEWAKSANFHISPPFFTCNAAKYFVIALLSVPVGSKQLIEQILEKDFFFKNDIFGIFRPKNHKNGQKTIFYFEKWKFFLHTLIIWEDQHFSCNTLFDSVKKSRQKWEKAEKMARAKKCPFSIFAHFF